MNDGSYRFRFTLAHEAAHLIAHSDLLKELMVSDPADSDGGMRGLGQKEYNALEFQANMIAGMILVPFADLEQQIKSERIQKAISKSHLIDQIDNQIELAARLLKSRYQVSQDVIKIRIEKEELI